MKLVISITSYWLISNMKTVPQKYNCYNRSRRKNKINKLTYITKCIKKNGKFCLLYKDGILWNSIEKSIYWKDERYQLLRKE
jgi:hypothetical protein